MTTTDFDDLKSFALVAFLSDYGAAKLLELDSKNIELIGQQAGLDEQRTERALAAMHEIYAAKGKEMAAWLRRNTN